MKALKLLTALAIVFSTASVFAGEMPTNQQCANAINSNNNSVKQLVASLSNGKGKIRTVVNPILGGR